jgi:hypothetical protein
MTPSHAGCGAGPLRRWDAIIPRTGPAAPSCREAGPSFEVMSKREKSWKS